MSKGSETPAGQRAAHEVAAAGSMIDPSSLTGRGTLDRTHAQVFINARPLMSRGRENTTAACP